MNNTDTLVNYINDVKPYHTKILEVSTTSSFSETASIRVTDSIPNLEVTFKDIWSYQDLDQLSLISDGTIGSQIIPLPSFTIPRFSATDVNQVPPGDQPEPESPDPSFYYQLGNQTIPFRLTPVVAIAPNLTSSTIVGTSVNYVASLNFQLPSADYTKLLSWGVNLIAEVRYDGSTYNCSLLGNNASVLVSGVFDTSVLGDFPANATLEQLIVAYINLKQAGLWIIQTTGRYQVPFHTGSKIYVNGILKTFQIDYTVDQSRGFVQFFANKHPLATDQIKFNLFNCDRIFVANNSPFVVGADSFDILTNASLNEFSPFDASPYDSLPLNSLPPVSSTVIKLMAAEFSNSQPLLIKPNLGIITRLAAPIEATYKLIAIGPFALSVQRITPTIGPLSYAYINIPFNNGDIAFTLQATFINYSLTSSPLGYFLIDTPPRLDTSDFWPIPTDQQLGLTIAGAGQVAKTDSKWAFVFNSPPTAGNFIDVRLEQAKQYNPRAEASIREDISINVFSDEPIGLDTSPYDSLPLNSGHTIKLIIHHSSQSNQNVSDTDILIIGPVIP